MTRVSFALVVLVSLFAAQSVTALTCVLLHGIGQDGPQTKTTNVLTDPNYVRSSLPSYWGDLDVRMKKAGCATVVALWTDSNTRGWSDHSLQAEYCGILKQVSADVVFAHSMGGMVLSAGINNKVSGCERIGNAANSLTHWYGLQSPLGGSKAADALAEVCTNSVVAMFLGKDCAKNSQGKVQISAAYSSLQTPNAPAWLKSVALAHESGNMCGILTDNTAANVDGSLMAKVDKTAVGIALTTLKDLVGQLQPDADWTSGNKPTASGSTVIPLNGCDGMVAWGSCRTKPANAYHKDPAQTYYAFEGNHGDGRCTYGEDPNNKNYQPCSYVENMVKRTAALKAHKFQQIFDEDEAEADDEIEAEDEDEINDEDEAEDEAEDETDVDDEAEAEDEAEDESEADAESDAEADVEDAADMEDFLEDAEEAERYEFADA